MMIESKIVAGVVIFKMIGRIDLEQIGDLDLAFNEYFARDHIRFILNFVDVTDISSSGLGKILSMFKKLELKGGRLVLSDLSAVSEYVLDLARLTDIFPIYKSDELALESFEKPA